MTNKVKFQKFIYREDLIANRDTVYVFGDNMARKGLGGQAREMRHEPNAIGVPTKWYPSMTDDSFFNDSDYEKVVEVLKKDFVSIKDALQSGKKIVFPADGLGTGLSQLQSRSPKIFAYIENSVIEIVELSKR
jgi:hypothetical protein